MISSKMLTPNLNSFPFISRALVIIFKYTSRVFPFMIFWFISFPKI